MCTLTEMMSWFCDYSAGTSHNLSRWLDARQYWVWYYWSVLNCRKPFTLCLIVLTDIMAVWTAFLESLGVDKYNWIKLKGFNYSQFLLCIKSWSKEIISKKESALVLLQKDAEIQACGNVKEEKLKQQLFARFLDVLILRDFDQSGHCSWLDTADCL